MDFLKFKKKRKHAKAEEFVKEMQKIHEEAKAVLKKLQEEMKKYADRNRKKAVEYKERDRMLSMKDLMQQIRNKEMKKLTEKFVGPYKIKKIILENTVELELLVLMKIHLVVNVSRVAIERQKKISSHLVEIDIKKEYKVEKILNRRDVRGKLKYLVRQEVYMAKEDTCERLENLGNVIDLVEGFEKKIREEEIRKVQMRKEKGKKRVLNLEAEVFKRSKLLEKYTTKILFGQDDRKFEDKYLKKLERIWVGWKEKERQNLKGGCCHGTLEPLYFIFLFFFFNLFSLI